MTTDRERTPADPRVSAPSILAVLSGSLLVADRALAGTAQTVARIVLVIAVIAASAWCGRVVWGVGRTGDRG